MFADRTESPSYLAALDRAYFAYIGRLTPAQRLQMAMRASRAYHHVILAELRSRFPDASDEELEMRAVARRVGPRLMLLAFGAAAEAWIE